MLEVTAVFDEENAVSAEILCLLIDKTPFWDAHGAGYNDMLTIWESFQK